MVWVIQSDKKKRSKKVSKTDVPNVPLDKERVLYFVKGMRIDLGSYYKYNGQIFKVTGITEKKVFLDLLDEHLMPEPLGSGKNQYKIDKQKFQWDYTKMAGPIPTRGEIQAMTLSPL